MELRDAAEEDLAGLVAIYNDVIATSTAVYSDTPVTLEDRRQWWRARLAAGYPVLVAADDSGRRPGSRPSVISARGRAIASRWSTPCTFAPTGAAAASARSCSRRCFPAPRPSAST